MVYFHNRLSQIPGTMVEGAKISSKMEVSCTMKTTSNSLLHAKLKALYSSNVTKKAAESLLKTKRGYNYRSISLVIQNSLALQCTLQ